MPKYFQCCVHLVRARLLCVGRDLRREMRQHRCRCGEIHVVHCDDSRLPCLRGKHLPNLPNGSGWLPMGGGQRGSSWHGLWTVHSNRLHYPHGEECSDKLPCNVPALLVYGMRSTILWPLCLVYWQPCASRQLRLCLKYHHPPLPNRRDECKQLPELRGQSLLRV